MKTIKALHCADIHLSGGPDDDASRALTAIAIEALRHEVDVVHVNGDVFDSKSTPEQRLVFKNFLQVFRDKHIPVVVLRGNHDEAGDLMIYDDRHNDIYVVEKPESLALLGGEYRVFCVPHFHAGRLALNCDNQRDVGAAGTAAFDEMLDMLWNEANLWRGQAMALVFHGMTTGSCLDNGYVPRTNGIQLSPDRLAVFPGPAIGGHIHKFQDVTGEGRVFYSGSPAAHTFGEESQKGFIIMEHTGMDHRCQFVPIQTRPMYVLRGEYVEGAIQWADEALMVEARTTEGANIKVSCTVAKHDLGSFKAHMMHEAFPVAHTMKLETVVVVSETVRCPEIEATETVAESVKVWISQNETYTKRVDCLMNLYYDVTEKQNEPLAVEPVIDDEVKQACFSF